MSLLGAPASHNTPECNPSEHLWDELREKGYANQFFATLDAVEVQLKTQLELLAV